MNLTCLIQTFPVFFFGLIPRTTENLSDLFRIILLSMPFKLDNNKSYPFIERLFQTFDVLERYINVNVTDRFASNA